MCRLALFNKAGEKLIEEKYGFQRFLSDLELSNGGMGNGIAMIVNNKIKIKKGLAFEIEDVAKILKNTNYTWAIFHTRIASAGEISDTNCHPFKSGDLVLAMNGTEHWASKIAGSMGNITDTEVITRLTNKLKLDVKTLKNYNSVFVGFKGLIPFVVKSKFGDLEITYDKDTKGIIFASELPDVFKKKYTFEGFWGLNKETLLPSNVKMASKKSKIGYYAYDYDDDGELYSKYYKSYSTIAKEMEEKKEYDLSKYIKGV